MKKITISKLFKIINNDIENFSKYYHDIHNYEYEKYTKLTTIQNAMFFLEHREKTFNEFTQKLEKFSTLITKDEIIDISFKLNYINDQEYFLLKL